MKITKVAQILGLLFSKVNLDKNGLGYIFGDFFLNSSGHPAPESLQQLPDQTLVFIAPPDRSTKSGTRVTRLGNFSPVGRLFTLRTFLKIAEVAHMFGLFFPTVKFIYVLIFQTMELAIFWAFLHKLIWSMSGTPR
jgi:hypothetical protein